MGVWGGHGQLTINYFSFLSFSIFLFVSPSLQLGPGPGPFGNNYLPQPVGGAQRGEKRELFLHICDVTKHPYNAVGDGVTVNTEAIQRAIDTCSQGKHGGTVLFPKKSGVFVSSSLFLKSDITLRIEAGATLQGTKDIEITPMVYTRREAVMMDAYAGLLNGGRCLKKKDPLVGWDDCEEWTKISNVVIEGDGVIDGGGDVWIKQKVKYGITRPCLMDLLWVDGLTIRNLKIIKPGFWTIHPCFSNNVRITGLHIFTRGSNTDGIDPDSSWNMFIGNNYFDTGDDCIALKAGGGYSGLKVNISTQNVLVQDNNFQRGHGVSIGSETSGWIQNVVFKNMTCNQTQHAVRIKSNNGRGGGVRNILYDGITGSISQIAIMLKLHYFQRKEKNSKEIVIVTNKTIPHFSDIVIKNMDLKAPFFFWCEGDEFNEIKGMRVENINLQQVRPPQKSKNGVPSSKSGNSNFVSYYCMGTWENVNPEPIPKNYFLKRVGWSKMMQKKNMKQITLLEYPHGDTLIREE